jgi:hypothetical protein
MEVVGYLCYEKGQEIKGGFPCVFWWEFWLVDLVFGFWW